MLAPIKYAFVLTVFIDKHPAETEAGCPTLTIAEADEATLPRENLNRQLTTVFTCHHLFDGRHNRRTHRAVVLDLLGAVMNGDACALAQPHIMRCFIGVLEAPPATYIVNENGLEIDVATLDVGQKLLK